MPRKEVDREVASMLQDLQLVDKTKTAAKNLSGGMKRKLRYSMCVADQSLGLHSPNQRCHRPSSLLLAFFSILMSGYLTMHIRITNRSFVMSKVLRLQRHMYMCIAPAVLV